MFNKLLAFGALALVVSCSSAGATIVKGTTARTADASVDHSRIEVGGTPFFPVMLIDQCTATDVGRARSLGVNLILNESCPGSQPIDQLARLGGPQLGVLPIQASGTATGARLLGWTYPDEPENNGWTPEKLAAAFPYPRGNPDGLLSFVTTTSAFAQAPYRDPKISPRVTGAFARMADVAGFDLYPLNHCQHDLSAVYDAQRRFLQLAGHMPTFQWIETGPLKPSYCGGFQMTPAQLTAEAWLAITGGARGIGFFTHTWTPAPRAFDVSETLQRTIRRFSTLVGAVKPGLLGTTVPSGANSPAIKVLARAGAGRTYVFAVNDLPRPIGVQVAVPQLANGSLRVLGEKRSVQVKSHQFVDTFQALAVHVYVQAR